MPPRISFRIFVVLLAFALAGCTAAFGPGYTIDKQQIRVQFSPEPQPHLSIQADYQLRNTGNRPLTSLEIRLPGHRRFHFTNPNATWDGNALAFQSSPANPRNQLIQLPQPWTVSASHSLRLSVEFTTAPSGDAQASFAADAFALPSEGWSPELLPARGSFATGGIPPKKWNLEVELPADFLVHLSGLPPKKKRHGDTVTLVARQRLQDHYPFVIAGRFKESRLGSGRQTFYLWSRAEEDPAILRSASDLLQRTTQAYDTEFGSRDKAARPIWVVECPVLPACFSSVASSTAPLLGQDTRSAEPTAEMISLDTVLADLRNGAPQLATAVGPSLSESWLGYGQNPGFFEQDLPLALLPAFAADIGREALEGPASRATSIRHLLTIVPAQPTPQQDQDRVIARAKSLLFFFALQDKYGRDTFRKAITHMLAARRGGGFNLDDLIASLGAESHQNVAEFVRLWMKHPGIPADFRSRYEGPALAVYSNSQGATP